MPPKHDLCCPRCGEDYRFVEKGDVTSFCNMCAFTFINRDVQPKRAKTDLAGQLMDKDDG